MADYPCFRRRTRCRSFPSSWCRHWKKSCLVRCHNTNFDRMPNHSSIRMLDKRESNSSIVSRASGRQAFIPTHKSCCQCQSNFINAILFVHRGRGGTFPVPCQRGFVSLSSVLLLRLIPLVFVVSSTIQQRPIIGWLRVVCSTARPLCLPRTRHCHEGWPSRQLPPRH